MPRPAVDFPRRMTTPSPERTDALIKAALAEDLGDSGDVTARALLSDSDKTVTARVIAKEDGVACGIGIARRVFEILDMSVQFEALVKDGDAVAKGNVLFKLKGRASSITTAERTSLNFVGFLSGVATKARQISLLVAGTGLKILDTRKTIPGLRELQKYAVQCGGAHNHRIGLFDMVLIKENHITAAGGVTRAVELARKNAPGMVVEVELETYDQVREALNTSADIFMLDNMDNKTVAGALAIINGARYVEVSGNMTEDRLKELAALGVDFVSMGSLTHTVKPLDISLLID